MDLTSAFPLNPELSRSQSLRLDALKRPVQGVQKEPLLDGVDQGKVPRQNASATLRSVSLGTIQEMREISVLADEFPSWFAMVDL